MKKIHLIGDVCVDVTLKSKQDNYKLRLGGIIHVARALWGMNIPYSISYFSPSYLDEEINKYLEEFGCSKVEKIGDIKGSPNIFLIENVREEKEQGYQHILKDCISIDYNDNSLKSLSKLEGYEVLFISGNYNLSRVLKTVNPKNNFYIDLANNFISTEQLDKIDFVFETIFISTSSDIFKNEYQNEFLVFSELFQRVSKKFVLKENRGGSRAIDYSNGEILNIYSQTQPVKHSVGVGDVYNAAFIIGMQKYSMLDSLTFASWLAAEYASTTYPRIFKTACETLIKSDISSLKNFGGVFLPWEKRRLVNIYIAAPDFDYVDRTNIDNVVKCLEYHNFCVKRPILENGQLSETSTDLEKFHTYKKDMILLTESDIVVTILPFDDPGTLLEMGWAVAKNKAVILFDPNKTATNCMLLNMPDIVTSSLDEMICEVFIEASKIIQ